MCSGMMTSLSMQPNDEVNEEFHTKWEGEQQELKKKLICENTEPWQEDFGSLHYVGGVDVSFVKTSTTIACASLVICSFPDLKVVYSDCELVHLDTPYIPGFLAFREVGFFINLLGRLKDKNPDLTPQVDTAYIPCFLVFREAEFFLYLLDRLKDKNPDLTPQVILVDGNGILHPRGFGIASHLGVLSNIPCVGVAKTLMQVDGIAKDEQFTAKVTELTNGRDMFPLMTHSGQVLGMALRGCNKSSNPIFVSIGHQISLQTAIRLTHQCCTYRVAEPVRQADIRSRELLRERFPETVTGNKQLKDAARKANKHSDGRLRHSYANENKVSRMKGVTCFLDEDHTEESDEEFIFNNLFDPTS